MGERLQPAFWGGLFIGVLSALPIVQVGNCCCCLWIVTGGVLAAYLRQQQTPYAIQASEGALVGLMAGVFGGVLTVLISIPMHAITGPMQQRMMDWVLSANPDLPGEFRDAIQRASGDAALNPLNLAFSLVYYLVVGMVFGMLGGLLGAAVFKKNAPPPPLGTIEVLPPQP
ncbi:MAG TPA: hypothetical protein VE379_02285 [Vicinamibacterales bacterium]|jgi:hypothetical protein|nr:hypothetical protein [Vicinamibacterales bacterium]